MRAFVLTDIEGVAGIDSLERTRPTDEARKAPAMDQLARETRACVAGIRSIHPDTDCIVCDGHGTGGLRESDVVSTRGWGYISDGQLYWDLDGYDAVHFVGQHAMAGTAFAPLAHTYSSRHVAYYRLNLCRRVRRTGARRRHAGCPHRLPRKRRQGGPRGTERRSGYRNGRRQGGPRHRTRRALRRRGGV